MKSMKKANFIKILITQSQYEQLYNYLVNQLLGTMQATSTDMSYNKPLNL